MSQLEAAVLENVQLHTDLQVMFDSLKASHFHLYTTTSMPLNNILQVCSYVHILLKTQIHTACQPVMRQTNSIIMDCS